jgi:hypothetical protein
MAAWLGADAGVRELAYADRVGELAAHQISTATLPAARPGYMWLLDQRWPDLLANSNLADGRIWVLMPPVGMGFGPATLQRLRVIWS